MFVLRRQFNLKIINLDLDVSCHAMDMADVQPMRQEEL